MIIMTIWAILMLIWFVHSIKTVYKSSDERRKIFYEAVDKLKEKAKDHVMNEFKKEGITRHINKETEIFIDNEIEEVVKKVLICLTSAFAIIMFLFFAISAGIIDGFGIKFLGAVLAVLVVVDWVKDLNMINNLEYKYNKMSKFLYPVEIFYIIYVIIYTLFS